MSTADGEPSDVVIGAIEVFTKILDGGGPVRCVCGYVWRIPGLHGTPAPHENCPGCGRDSRNHTSEISDAEYKQSRRPEAS